MLKRLKLFANWKSSIPQYNLTAGASCAPDGLTGALFRSTPMSVGTAGWTEVVIPGASTVLTDHGVTCSHPIAISSNDDVLEVTLTADFVLRQAGSELVNMNAFEYSGFSALSRISCPNNYEVTL